MFSDLTNNSLNSINIGKVKAYPSVNSPNDGGFNSEENLRWLVKKILTKPFITGISDEDIKDAFAPTGGGPDGVYVNPGMFSSDGYTIKIAPTDYISFDAGNGGSGTDDNSRKQLNNTEYVQRFVQTLSNQGTENALSANLSDFVFERFSNANANQKENWQALDLNTQNLIGYIKNVYTDTFLNELTINYENLVATSITFGNTTVEISNSFNDSTTQDSTAFNDRTTPVAYLSSDDGNVVAVNIFYPVFVNNTETWNYNTEQYDLVPTIYFTDIFGLTFIRGLSNSYTKTYPRTNNAFIDMTGNEYFSGGHLGTGITFENCTLASLATKSYSVADLYESSGARKTSATSSVSNFSINDTMVGDDKLFTLVDHSNITNTMSSENTMSINNTVSYYCITDIPNDLKLDVTTVGGVTKVPVAFMTSSGELCTYGALMTGGHVSGTINSTFPVEGYMHFIKRLYLMYSEGIQSPTEEQIIAVETSDLCSWENQTVTVNGTQYSLGIQSIYSNYIAKPMCFYMDMCYSSLMQYVIYNTNGETDSYRMKSTACGYALKEFKDGHAQTDQYLTDAEFDITQTITYTGWSFGETTYIESEKTGTIAYAKEIDSDNYKIKTAVITGGSGTYVADHTLIDGITDFNDVNTNNYAVSVEDPINYIKKCACKPENISGYNTIQNVPIYALSNNEMTQVVFSISSSSTPGTIAYMTVDNYLMPLKIQNTSNFDTQANPFVPDSYLGYTLSNHEMYVLCNPTRVMASSLVNGQCLGFSQYTWYTTIPYVISLNKDALNYLIGQDFTNPLKYSGVNFSFKLPQDVLDTDLLIAMIGLSTTNVIGSNDTETCNKTYDTTSKKVKRARESCIHFDKLYGDNNESLEDKIQEEIANSDILEDVESDIQTLQTGLGNTQNDLTNLTSRVTAIDGTGGSLETINTALNTCLKVADDSIILIGSDQSITSIPANSNVTITKTLPYISAQSPYSLIIYQSIIDSDTIYNAFKPGISYDYYMNTNTNNNQDVMTIYIYNNTSSDITDVRIRCRIMKIS